MMCWGRAGGSLRHPPGPLLEARPRPAGAGYNAKHLSDLFCRTRFLNHNIHNETLKRLPKFCTLRDNCLIFKAVRVGITSYFHSKE